MRKTSTKMPYRERLYWYEWEKAELIRTAKTQEELTKALILLAKKWGI